jgi:DNA-binding XRE family transcriptional regulator
MKQDIKSLLFRPNGGICEDMESFAFSLLMWRGRHGLSQKELAKKDGVSRHTVMRVEAAKETVGWKSIYKLFRVVANEE